jgi:dihydrofolate reductase
MRKLILRMSVSIDGFVRGAEGERAWIFQTTDEESTAWTIASVWQAGAHVMGSRTFQEMTAHWPSSTSPFAPPMNQIPKIVFSRSAAARAHATPPPGAAPEALESWNAARVVITGDLAEEMGRLKQEPGKDLIAHGGAAFAQSLVRLGLVDEYQLLVHPVALGRGLPLFSELTAPLALELVDLKRFPRGAVAHVYRKRD